MPSKETEKLIRELDSLLQEMTDNGLKKISDDAVSLRERFREHSIKSLGQSIGASSALGNMAHMMDVSVAMAEELKRLEKERREQDARYTKLEARQKELEDRLSALETPRKVNLSKSGSTPGQK